MTDHLDFSGSVPAMQAGTLYVARYRSREKLRRLTFLLANGGASCGVITGYQHACAIEGSYRKRGVNAVIVGQSGKLPSPERPRVCIVAPLHAVAACRDGGALFGGVDVLSLDVRPSTMGLETVISIVRCVRPAIILWRIAGIREAQLTLRYETAELEETLRVWTDRAEDDANDR